MRVPTVYSLPYCDVGVQKLKIWFTAELEKQWLKIKGRV